MPNFCLFRNYIVSQSGNRAVSLSDKKMERMGWEGRRNTQSNKKQEESDSGQTEGEVQVWAKRVEGQKGSECSRVRIVLLKRQEEKEKQKTVAVPPSNNLSPYSPNRRDFPFTCCPVSCGPPSSGLRALSRPSPLHPRGSGRTSTQMRVLQEKPEFFPSSVSFSRFCNISLCRHLAFLSEVDFSC